MNKNVCSLCTRNQENKSNKNSNKNYNIEDLSQKYINLNSNLVVNEPNFYFNKKEIQDLLQKNISNGNEVISPCSCDKKFHKNCILLYLLYTNNITCEECLEVYNVKSADRVGYWSFLFTGNGFFNFLFSLFIIIITSILIAWISISKFDIPNDNYYPMKIFFIFILVITNVFFIYVTIGNCFNIKYNVPPISIWVEDKNKIFNEEEISNLNNIISENQNSHQNLFTNNQNNLYSLNYNKNAHKRSSITRKICKLARLHKINPNNYESLKNYSDYNEYFFNISKIEIMESKLNYLFRNKISVNKEMAHRDVIKELNDDEFQQNILIKHLDFINPYENLNRYDSSNYLFSNSLKDKKKKFFRSNSSLKNRHVNYNPNNIWKSNHKPKIEDNQKQKMAQNDFYDNDGIDYRSNNSESPKADSNFNGMLTKLLNTNHKINNSNSRTEKGGCYTYEKDSCEKIQIQNNTENFNTNINSNSDEKLKFSNKDLNNLSLSNVNYINNNNNTVGYNPQSINNNSNSNQNNENSEKLILKDNQFASQKNSNSNLNRNNTITLKKLKTKQSSKDMNSVESFYGNNKYTKGIDLNSDGFDYKDFIVTGERVFSSKNLGKFNLTKPKGKNSQDKLNIFIKSGVLGDINEANPKNSNYNQSNIGSVGSYDKSNMTTGNNNNNNNNNIQRILKQGKVIRRYSSFSPGIMNNLQSNNKKPFGQANNDNSSGMNIFSNNVITNFDLINKNISGNNFEAKKVQRKLTANNFSEFKSFKALNKMDNTIPSQNMSYNSYNNYNPSKGNFSRDEERSKNNLSLRSEEKIYSITQQDKNRRKINEIQNFRISHSNDNVILRKTTITNTINKSYFEQPEVNFDYDQPSIYKCLKLKKQVANTQVNVHKNFINKISQENSNLIAESLNLESFNSALYHPDNSKCQSFSPNKNRKNSILNSEENKYYKRTSLLANSPLNTINEDNENFFFKSNSKIMQVLDHISENPEEHFDQNQKNKLISSGNVSIKNSNNNHPNNNISKIPSISNNSAKESNQNNNNNNFNQKEISAFNGNINNNTESLNNKNTNMRNSLIKNSHHQESEEHNKEQNKKYLVKNNFINEVNLISEYSNSQSFPNSSNSSDEEGSDFFSLHYKDSKSSVLDNRGIKTELPSKNVINKLISLKDSGEISEVAKENKYGIASNSNGINPTFSSHNKNNQESTIKMEEEKIELNNEISNFNYNLKEAKLPSEEFEIRNNIIDHPEENKSNKLISKKKLINNGCLTFKNECDPNIRHQCESENINKNEKANNTQDDVHINLIKNVSIESQNLKKKSNRETIIYENHNDADSLELKTKLKPDYNTNHINNIITGTDNPVKSEFINNSDEINFYKENISNQIVFSQNIDDLINENNMEFNNSENLEDYQLANNSIDLETRINLMKKYKKSE